MGNKVTKETLKMLIEEVLKEGKKKPQNPETPVAPVASVTPPPTSTTNTTPAATPTQIDPESDMNALEAILDKNVFDNLKKALEDYFNLTNLQKLAEVFLREDKSKLEPEDFKLYLDNPEDIRNANVLKPNVDFETAIKNLRTAIVTAYSSVSGDNATQAKQSLFNILKYSQNIKNIQSSFGTTTGYKMTTSTGQVPKALNPQVTKAFEKAFKENTLQGRVGELTKFLSDLEARNLTTAEKYSKFIVMELLWRIFFLEEPSSAGTIFESFCAFMAFGGQAIGAENGMADFEWNEGKSFGSSKMVQSGSTTSQNLKDLKKGQTMTYVVGYKTTNGHPSSATETPDKIQFYTFGVTRNQQNQIIFVETKNPVPNQTGKSDRFQFTHSDVISNGVEAGTLDLTGISKGLFSDHSDELVDSIDSDLSEMLTAFSDLKSNIDNFLLSYDEQNERKIYSDQAILTYGELENLFTKINKPIQENKKIDLKTIIENFVREIVLNEAKPKKKAEAYPTSLETTSTFKNIEVEMDKKFKKIPNSTAYLTSQSSYGHQDNLPWFSWAKELSENLNSDVAAFIGALFFGTYDDKEQKRFNIYKKDEGETYFGGKKEMLYNGDKLIDSFARALNQYFIAKGGVKPSVAFDEIFKSLTSNLKNPTFGETILKAIGEPRSNLSSKQVFPEDFGTISSLSSDSDRTSDSGYSISSRTGSEKKVDYQVLKAFENMFSAAGDDFSSRLKALEIYVSDVKNLLNDKEALKGQSMQEKMSKFIVFDVMSEFLLQQDPTVGGWIFESFLALMVGGASIGSSYGPADFKFHDGADGSAKFLAKPQSSQNFEELEDGQTIRYVFAVKSQITKKGKLEPLTKKGKLAVIELYLADVQRKGGNITITDAIGNGGTKSSQIDNSDRADIDVNGFGSYKLNLSMFADLDFNQISGKILNDISSDVNMAINQLKISRDSLNEFHLGEASKLKASNDAFAEVKKAMIKQDGQEIFSTSTTVTESKKITGRSLKKLIEESFKKNK